MASFRNAQRKPYNRPTTRGDVDGQWVHDKAPTGPRGRASAARGAATPTGPAVANNKLLVSNLHYEVTPKDLTSVFGQIGTLIREPLLRYDRSGRSTGSAIIYFETAVEATRAKKQFQGYLAKGQPMTIAYDTLPPRAPRRATSAPSTTSLLNRIEKPPLAERLTVDDAKIPSGPRAFTGGPVRSGRSSRGGNGARPPKGPKKPKTAEELDKELDAFMGDSEPTVVTTDAVASEAAQDVEMA